MKSQAETAGHLTNPGGAHPQKGTVLCDVDLTMADGSRCLLSSLRGSASLVMVFTAGRDLHPLLADLENKKSALIEHNARVLVISTSREQPASELRPFAEMFLIAFDDNGQVHRTLGATDAAQSPLPSIYITDRFGEVFAAFRRLDIPSLPNAEEIMGWLEFIEQQCEECSPPEWPE